MYNDKKILKYLAGKSLVCSMGSLQTSKLPSFSGKIFFLVFFINGHEKCILYNFKKNFKTLFGSQKVISYYNTFKYKCYKKVFLDKNLKTRFADMKKLQKATLIKKSQTKFLSDLI